MTNKEREAIRVLSCSMLALIHLFDRLLVLPTSKPLKKSMVTDLREIRDCIHKAFDGFEDKK